jgi:hypothetical protein
MVHIHFDRITARLAREVGGIWWEKSRVIRKARRREAGWGDGESEETKEERGRSWNLEAEFVVGSKLRSATQALRAVLGFIQTVNLQT